MLNDFLKKLQNTRSIKNIAVIQKKQVGKDFIFHYRTEINAHSLTIVLGVLNSFAHQEKRKTCVI